MSTDGSDSVTSSQIRRFGLYRTIDAKTEEFLRLSRKRQIRQGCACAAISTTITVAVVVSLIVVYKYNIFENNSRTTLTPSWLNLMNTSVDNLPFEVKLDKTKLALDPTSIKFLPLLLKTLKKNKYFDRITEETSSQNPFQGKTEQEVYSVKDKNIFSDARNWMRMPTSRVYAVEYKTSPIVYFKNPTRNIDYFTKVRKIRDYQRIMNYVDKMISERVTFGSTVPMNKNIHNFNKNSITMDYTTPMTIAKDLKTQNKNIKKSEITSPKKKPHCSCPKKMNELLSKLISSLQKMMPRSSDLPDKSSHVSKPCHQKTTETHQEITLKPKSVSPSKLNRFATPISVAISEETYINPHITTPLPKFDYTLNSIIALLKPIIRKNNIKTNNFLASTTTRNYIEGTDRGNNLEKTTLAMKNITNIKAPNATSIKDYILRSNTKSRNKPFTTHSKEYEDYFEVTTSYAKNHITADSELQISNNINMKGQIVNKIKEGKRFFDYNLDIMESENLPNKKIKLEFSSSSPTTDILDKNWETSYDRKPLSTETFTTTSSSNYVNLEQESSTNPPKIDNKMEQTLKPDDLTLEEELEKTSPEDVTAEENIKNLENLIKKLNNSEVHNQTTTEDSLYEWELIKIEDNYGKNDIFAKSMIPEDKGSYLEIQRNDWKQAEHQDYDNNINHYLFE